MCRTRRSRSRVSRQIRRAARNASSSDSLAATSQDSSCPLRLKFSCMAVPLEMRGWRRSSCPPGGPAGGAAWIDTLCGAHPGLVQRTLAEDGDHRPAVLGAPSEVADRLHRSAAAAAAAEITSSSRLGRSSALRSRAGATGPVPAPPTTSRAPAQRPFSDRQPGCDQDDRGIGRRACDG